MFEIEMKKIIFVWMLCTSTAYGQSINMAIPNAPQSFQSDRIRAGDIECSMAIGSSTNVEFGVVGILDQTDPLAYQINQDPYFNYNPDTFMRDIGVYGRITIPIGGPEGTTQLQRTIPVGVEEEEVGSNETGSGTRQLTQTTVRRIGEQNGSIERMDQGTDVRENISRRSGVSGSRTVGSTSRTTW